MVGYIEAVVATVILLSSIPCPFKVRLSKMQPTTLLTYHFGMRGSVLMVSSI